MNRTSRLLLESPDFPELSVLRAIGALFLFLA
jgi:hypothetical protein